MVTNCVTVSPDGTENQLKCETYYNREVFHFKRKDYIVNIRGEALLGGLQSNAIIHLKNVKPPYGPLSDNVQSLCIILSIRETLPPRAPECGFKTINYYSSASAMDSDAHAAACSNYLVFGNGPNSR